MITSRRRSTCPRVPRSQSRAILLAGAAGLVLASSAVLGQTSSSSPGRAMPPAREGNIYGGKDHQPTEADVSGAGAGGIDSSSPASKAEVEQGVEQLLEQTNIEDENAERRLDDSPSGPSRPQPNDGR